MSKQSIDAKLQNAGVERSVLCGIIEHGSNCFLDLQDLLCPQDFYWNRNKKLFAVLKYLVEEKGVEKMDLPSILSAIATTKTQILENAKDPAEFIESFFVGAPTYDNTLKLATNISKLSIARKGVLKLSQIKGELLKVTGDEPIEDIISMIEDPIFGYTGELISGSEGVQSLCGDFLEALKSLTANPQDMAGLSTGFPRWDAAIGGGLRRGSVNILSARPKIGKCIGSHNTIIPTSIGMLMPYEIFDVRLDQKKSCKNLFNMINEYGKSKTPEYWWNNGLVEVIDIVTKCGNTLSATHNHPVRILDRDGSIKWKQAKDLQVGEYLVGRRGDRYWGSKEVDIEDAYVIGLLVGDRHIKREFVILSNVENSCKDAFRNFINRMGGDIGREIPTELRCHRRKVNEDIVRMGFYDNNKLKIFPKHMRMSKEKYVCQMLSGYFDADGCVEKGGVTSTTNSKKLSIQLKGMLLNLGIRSTTRARRIIPPNHTQPRTYWETAIREVESVRLFRDLIGFRINRKQKLLEKFCNKRSLPKHDIVPNLCRPLDKLKKAVKNDRGFFLSGHRNNMRDVINRWIRGERRATRNAVKSMLKEISQYSNFPEYKIIESLIDPKLFFDPIVSLVDGKEWTSDFYIPDGHSFISNGIISHNSFFCLNVAKNIAGMGVPVLYLDTELGRTLQRNRFISLVSKTSLEDIETGQFSKNAETKKQVWDCKEEIEKLNIEHCSISGQSSQNAMSVARRWLSKHVGFNDQGQANPCLIIYDYLKLTSSLDIKANMQEHQLLGFLVSELHDFCLRWGLPILAAAQLNRDGVEKEGAQFAAGSDRILWLSSSFTILKNKTSQELGDDPPSNGTKKLLVTDTRFGSGMNPGEYINIVDNLDVGRFKEGITNTEAINQNFNNEKI